MVRLQIMPPSHRVGVRTPRGGTTCSTCRYFSATTRADAPHGTCTSPYYKIEQGTNAIGAPADEWCSDYWEPSAAAMREHPELGA